MASTDPKTTPIPAQQLRSAMSLVPTAVAVITAATPAGPAGMTAVAVDSLSLDPPLMLVCMDRGSRTLAALQEAGRFGINLLGVDQQELAINFSAKGPPGEKFEGIAWADRDGLPALEGTMLWFGCELRDLHDGGDHLIATGRVIDMAENAGDPLIFHDGQYRGIAK